MTRREIFESHVIVIARRLIRQWPKLRDVDFAVEDVPPVDPSPWEDGVALAKLFDAESGYRTRIVLYRRPILDRSADNEHVRAIVRELVVEQAAIVLQVDPSSIDPDFDLER